MANLVFECRSGISGAGDTIRGRYDDRSRTWSWLTPGPALFHGGTAPNAYPTPLVLGPDGGINRSRSGARPHLCETNHDIGYVWDRDLIHWQPIDGKALELAVSLDAPGVIVDDISLCCGDHLRPNGEA
jgi:hypothetical protein